MTQQNSEQTDIGRNAACPCGSGKKYKRCCGVGAAPKLSTPAQSADKSPDKSNDPATPNTPDFMQGFDPQAIANMYPEWTAQIKQALHRLPKSQMQQWQMLIQKAMSGKDVSKEAAEFQRKLPADLQALFQNFGNAMAMNQGTPTETPSHTEMTEEQARQIVAQAAKSGKISSTEADALLKK